MSLSTAFEALSVTLICLAGSGKATQLEDLEDHLEETSFIDHRHPLIRDRVARVTDGLESEREKAIAIHDFVRDEILFGFEPAFYAMKASKVLAARRGYCNNQATLFIAMLRAAGIPARHRFYSLSSSVLDGIIDTGTTHVDHSITEVYLDERWIALDSYIIDPPMAAGVRARTTATLGLGMRGDGVTEWDGRSDAFSQYHPDFVRIEYGVFRDVGHFYDKAPNPDNKLGPISRLFFRMAVSGANKRIENLREGHSR